MYFHLITVETFDFELYTSFWFRKALSIRKALFMKQPTKVSVQTFLEKFCQNLAWKCFRLNLILSFYRFVHFGHFSGIKICKICDTLPFLTQNLLLNPPLFLSVFLFPGSWHLFQLFLISNMTLMNFFLKRGCSRIVTMGIRG